MPGERDTARACLLELFKEWDMQDSTFFYFLKHAVKEDNFCVFVTSLYLCLKWFLFQGFCYWCVFFKFEGIHSWTTGGNENDWKIWIYENSWLFANCWMSGLVGIISTFGPLSSVGNGLYLVLLGPFPAAHAFGAASAKNSCGVLAN